MFEKGDFSFTFDLRDTYPHIEIFQSHHTYLGFQWTEKHRGAKGETKTRKVSCFVREDIHKFVFLLAEEKCTWDPSPIATWLGHVWNIFSCTVKETDERMERLDSTLVFKLVLGLWFV